MIKRGKFYHMENSKKGNTMNGPYHYFFLNDIEVSPMDSFVDNCQNKSRAFAVVSDDVILFFSDYFKWITTIFIVDDKKIIGNGFDLEGWSIIDEMGKFEALNIICAIQGVLKNSPTTFTLTGGYDLNADDYDKIEVSKEHLLNEFDCFIKKISLVNSRYYIMHVGI